MKLAIVGSRSFNNYFLLEKIMEKYNPELIICGGARGADTLGEKYALENNIPIKYFLPDWDKHGKKAGILRNIDMSNDSTHVLAFWDGTSKGTKQMIEYSKRNNKIVEIIQY